MEWRLNFNISVIYKCQLSKRITILSVHWLYCSRLKIFTNIMMISWSQSTFPFTKQALQVIFNRYAPSFSCETNITSNANRNLSSGSDIKDNNLSNFQYLEHKFLSNFNNHYDQYANMLIRNYLSRQANIYALTSNIFWLQMC